MGLFIYKKKLLKEKKEKGSYLFTDCVKYSSSHGEL